MLFSLVPRSISKEGERLDLEPFLIHFFTFPVFLEREGGIRNWLWTTSRQHKKSRRGEREREVYPDSVLFRGSLYFELYLFFLLSCIINVETMKPDEYITSQLYLIRYPYFILLNQLQEKKKGLKLVRIRHNNPSAN